MHSIGEKPPSLLLNYKKILRKTGRDDLCNLVLQFTGKERAFLDRYYDEGKIDEALLVEDGVFPPLKEHPAIKWRLDQRKNIGGTGM